MSRKIETNDRAYGWTEESIKISEAALSHIDHHVRNPLCVLICKINRLPEGPDKEMMIEKADEITAYLEWLKTNIISEAEEGSDPQTQSIDECQPQ